MSREPALWAPSILAADFSRLGEQVRDAEQAGANRIHVDVMDGHFVPNLSMGPVVVSSLKPITKLRLETHLMVEAPDRIMEAFVAAGSQGIIVHVEGNPNLHRTLARIKELGQPAGVALNPGTPAHLLDAVLGDVDLVLVMTVNPGFGGQAFIESTLAKIRQVRSMIDARGLRCELEVDGGIDARTAPLAYAAGARVFVAGSSVFNKKASARENLQTLDRSIPAPTSPSV